MAKSNTVIRVTVETRIGKIRFAQKPNGAFVVRCKGHETIRIRQLDGSTDWFAYVGGKLTTAAKSPEKAFKKAIRVSW